MRTCIFPPATEHQLLAGLHSTMVRSQRHQELWHTVVSGSLIVQHKFSEAVIHSCFGSLSKSDVKIELMIERKGAHR